ncbi:hypothetical protein Tco_0868805, partial [Tanacetum coccineum]
MPFNHYCAVQAAMVGFFMAYFIDSLTSVGLVDQMENFFCKTLLFVAIAGVLLRRKNEDVDNLKKLLDETTFYDNHEKKEVWRGKWGPLVVESGEGGGWEEEVRWHDFLGAMFPFVLWAEDSAIGCEMTWRKCGRLVESEISTTLATSQRQGIELVKAQTSSGLLQRKRSKHEELNLWKKSKDKKKSKNLLSKSAYKEMADLQEELRVVKNDSFAPKVTSEGNSNDVESQLSTKHLTMWLLVWVTHEIITVLLEKEEMHWQKLSQSELG